MSKGKLVYLGLVILFGCSTIINENQIEGHWHCFKSGECEFETIDIKDSTIISDKYIVGSYNQYLFFTKNNNDMDKDVEVQNNGSKLVLNYVDTSFNFVRSDLKKCLVLDRYMHSMIDLTLSEVESALPYDISKTNYTTGDFLIGKLKRGIDQRNDKLSQQYPDSVFIQVNDVLISLNDIPDYIFKLKDIMDAPKTNINLHADKDVPEGFLMKVVRLINPSGYRTTVMHNVVKIKDGDIGLLRK